MAGKELLASVENQQKRNGQILTFVGPEGSGKSTQAKFFATYYGIPYISVSDLIREKAQTDTTEIGIECRDVFRERRYIDSNVLTAIYRERFSREDTNNGFVLDGAMRTEGEINNFDEVLWQTNRMLNVRIVYLKIPVWLSADRLLNGRKREDDTLEGVLSRLTHYYRHLGKRAVMMKRKWDFLQVAIGQYDLKEGVYERIKREIDALDRKKDRCVK